MISRHSLNGKWPQVPLGEVVEFLDHLRKPVTAKDRVAGPIPYYGANGQQDSVADYIFDESLVLLAEDGGHFGDPTRTIAYHIEGKSWVNNHAHVLRPTDKIDIRFLCRHLERYDVTPFTSGTTRLKLNKNQASKIPIALPPLSEQKRIADILDKADAVRRKRQEAIQLLNEVARSDFLDTADDPFANSKGFPTRTLDKLFDIRTGKLDANAAVEGGKYRFFTCSRENYAIDVFAFDREALILSSNNASADYSEKQYKGKFNAYQRTYVLGLKEQSHSYSFFRQLLEYKLNEMKHGSRGTNTVISSSGAYRPTPSICLKMPCIKPRDSSHRIAWNTSPTS